MRTTFCYALLLGLSLLVPPAAADLIIEMEVLDAEGDPLGTDSVPAGTPATVNVSFSVTGDDNPLLDIRGLRLDFRNTPDDITIDSFAWEIDPGLGDVSYLILNDLPAPSAVYTAPAGIEGLILNLSDEPTHVATFEITINGTGTLDLANSATEDLNRGARVDAGFTELLIFSPLEGNLTGGLVDVTVPGGGGGGGGGDGGGGDVEDPPDGDDIPIEDADGDGVSDDEDEFPDDPAEDADTDGDGEGDNADPDDDNDGVEDDEDEFPDDAGESVDTDGDGEGDNADPDDDNDGVEDDEDEFPDDAGESVDTDGDGQGDNADPDDDNDGVPDEEDAFPLDPTQSSTSRPTTRRGCGAGMISPALFSMLGLTGMRFARRRRHAA
jgi:hypothetical protein